MHHERIVTIYDVLTDGDRDCIVMELLEGTTLKDALRGKKLCIPETFSHGIQIADGLAAAHAIGIVHRDLKPGNIMLTKSGIKSWTSASPNWTMTRLRLPGMWSWARRPTWLPNNVPATLPMRDPTSALGLILSEMATGVRERNIPTDQSLPPQFVHLVERCLANDPDDRWQSVRDLKAEMDGVSAI